MDSSTHITQADLSSIASPERVRIIQIIYGALGLGMLMMAAILAAVTGPGELDTDLPRILSMVHAPLALSSFFTGMMLFQQRLRGIDRLTDRAKIIPYVTSAYLVRAALFEGPAFFGLIILVLAGKLYLAEHPVYWANAASAFFFLGMLAMTFPTPDRIRDILRQYLNARP